MKLFCTHLTLHNNVIILKNFIRNLYLFLKFMEKFRYTHKQPKERNYSRTHNFNTNVDSV